MLDHLVSETYLKLLVFPNSHHTGKMNKAVMIKTGFKPEMKAVPTDIIPLVDINAVSFVSNNL